MWHLGSKWRVNLAGETLVKLKASGYSSNYNYNCAIKLIYARNNA